MINVGLSQQKAVFSSFNLTFQVMNDESGYVSYVGYKNTIIKYDPEVGFFD